MKANVDKLIKKLKETNSMAERSLLFRVERDNYWLDNFRVLETDLSKEDKQTIIDLLNKKQ